jgi:glycosyltransferase involved in cell wall biosynthesis
MPLHVAIISFGYPPLAHVSAKRPSYMARELRRFGDEVSVVTVDWRPPSEARASDGDVRVIRIDPRAWYPSFDPDARPIFIERPVEGPSHLRRARTLWRIFRLGPYAPWAVESLRRLRALHEAQPIDVVWAIHGDDSAHEIAYRFHRATGVPWVADFKDPWDSFHGGVAVTIQRAATQRRLATARALTETAAAQAERDRQFGRPVHVVWSGYSDDVMARAASVRSSSAFSLVYMGNISPQHDADAIGRTLARWRAKGGGDLELHVYGQRDPTPLVEILERHGVADLARFHPFLREADAFERLRGADLLLLAPSTKRSTANVLVGVKELEYFASGSPVLSLGPLLDEIRSVAGPNVAEARDDDDAVQIIEEELDAFAAGRPSPRRTQVNAPTVARHAWPAQARTLHDVLLYASERCRSST